MHSGGTTRTNEVVFGDHVLRKSRVPSAANVCLGRGSA